MTNGDEITTTDERVMATVAIKAWRFDVNNRTPVTVQVLAQQNVAKENRGVAKELIREMAEREDAPLRWDDKALDRVTLAGADTEENRGWVRSWVKRHDPDRELPWDLRE